MAEMTRADVIERLRWIDREAHDEWVLVPAEREVALRHAIAALADREQAQEAMNLPVTSAQIQPLSVLEPDKAHTDKQLTGVHKSRPLSREAKEQALTAAFNSGYCFHANNDSVESAELSAKARRLLDLDPEDA